MFDIINIMICGLKMRIKPSTKQQELLNHTFGCVRWIWNYALTLAQQHYQETKEMLSVYEIKKHLPHLKKEYPWLKDVHSQPLQESILNYGKARSRFLKRQSGYPRLKSKRSKQSFQYPQGVKVDEENQRVYLPKIGWIRCVLHRELKGEVKTVTISKSKSGHYYASLTMDDGEETPVKVKEIEKVEALDLGLYDYAVNSEGVKYDNPRALKRAENRLRKRQKCVSRKPKGSKNREKARILLAKAHEKVSRVRHDIQHKLSHHLADENQAVIVEDLNVLGMMKNRRLAKSLSDAAFTSFVTKLTYKLERRGGHLVKVDRYFPSSKLCSKCEELNDELTLNIRDWVCSFCGEAHDRDINAAKNLLNEGKRLLKAAGLTVSACGDLSKTRTLALV